jgi:hypothetical protein
VVAHHVDDALLGRVRPDRDRGRSDEAVQRTDDDARTEQQRRCVDAVRVFLLDGVHRDLVRQVARLHRVPSVADGRVDPLDRDDEVRAAGAESQVHGGRVADRDLSG